MKRLLLLGFLLGMRLHAQAPPACMPGTAVDTLDANNVRAALFNQGGLFWNGHGNVYNVPKARRDAHGYAAPNAIFVASLWFGGYVGSELLQTNAEYFNWEFIPGPLDVQGQPPSDCVAYDRIAALRLSDLQALRQGIITDAVRAWPWQWGAPVVDGDGIAGNYNLAGGDRPELLGTESHWWVMNAMGPHPRTGSKPFPLEVQVTAFATPTLPTFTGAIPALDHATLYRYRLIWKGSVPMTAVHFGFYVDPDLGNATDDYVGTDSLLRMAYVYNADNFDDGSEGYGATPPALGLLAVGGPPLHDDDGHPETAGLTAAQYWQEEDGIRNGPNLHRYNLLRGLNIDGTPVTMYGMGTCLQRHYNGCPATAPSTRWKWSGDPVTKSFWSEFQPTPGGYANSPSDRRFTAGTGPFVLQPGVPVDVVFAFVWARGRDHLDSVTQLRGAAMAVQGVWNAGGYAAAAQQSPEPEPPAPPALAVSAVTPIPLRTSGQITVSLPDAARVRAWVLDARGQTVARLVDDVLGPGTHVLPIDATGWASGAYAVRVAVGSETVARRFVVVQ